MSNVLIVNPPAERSRHVKLYVFCQCVGWTAWTLAYVGLGQLQRTLTSNEIWISIALNLIGWLITHLYRVLINARGWKQLAWFALLWRIIVASVLLGVLWTLAAWPLYLYCYTGVMPAKLSFAALLIYSAFNCTFLLFAWSAFYFGYHIYDRYRRSEVERAQLAATVKEAELRALKSQVNPHFIFNSLNSLRALIDEDPARARQAVTQLSNLLRYSLQSGQFETVPFEDELRVVNDYLALEQVRHEERLQLRFDIAPETLALPVPPMLLQTLVENAVKYGIATRPEGGEIAIIARCVGGALSIQVTNPGSLTSPSPSRAVSTGVGLRNAAERLRLLFGERATLHLRAETPSLVIAEAVLPLARA
ncbi:MAG: histidine kinase [Opitutus sp.]|nr:histidine kinase [Opitutus sp.]